MKQGPEMQNLPKIRVGAREPLLLAAPVIYLFVLPLAHLTAIRSISFGVSVLTLMWSWRWYDTPRVPLKAAFAVWFGTAALTLFWAVYPEFSIDEIRVEILYGFFAFLIFFQTTRSFRQLQIWLFVLLASALVTAVAALYHFLSGLPPYDTGVLYGGALSYVGYINIVLPMLAAMAILCSGYRRAGLLCLIVFLLLLAFGTTNRGVWFYLLVELAVFGGFYLQRTNLHSKAKRQVVLYITLAIIISTCLLLLSSKQRLNLSGGPAEIILGTAKADLRPLLWKDSFTWIAQRPFGGAGFGTMVLSKEMQEQQKNVNHGHAHNIFLNYALQLGIIGPFVILFLFFSVAREFWKLIYSSDKELQILGIAGITMVSGILAAGLIEVLFGRHLGWLFWALVGMTLGYAKNKVQPALGVNQPSSMKTSAQAIPRAVEH
jgi:O-antigen ligase